MTAHYFHRVTAQTPTRFWVNNPSREEADLAIAEGAVGCTTNPSYCQKMIDHPTEGSYARTLLVEAVRESRDDAEAEVLLQRKLVKPIVDKFLPIFERSGGKDGFVSIQGDPISGQSVEAIVAEGTKNRELGANVCVKVPVTAIGLPATEALVARGIPINGTEIFAVAQAISLCETYEKTTRKTGSAPKAYLSHIAGIYDDYLKRYVEAHGVDISRDSLWQAGLAVARKVHRLLSERNNGITFVGGGARGLHHFTEMVGGDVVVTINWKGTADKLLAEDPPVVHRLFNPVEDHVIDELAARLPDFRRGYLDDGLAVNEYEDFGPVALFRESFVKSWKRVLDLAKEIRLGPLAGD
jgi:transaldolase